jgi:hypothetical protein
VPCSLTKRVRGGVFDDAVLGSKHAGIGALRGRREDKHEESVGLDRRERGADRLQAGEIEPRAIDGTLVFERDEQGGIAGGDDLRPQV